MVNAIVVCLVVVWTIFNVIMYVKYGAKAFLL